MNSPVVLVVGGGIAGLTAAHELAKLGIEVELVEKKPFLGGHAIEFTCKAAESCAKCGACMAEEKLHNVISNEKIRTFTGSNINKISKTTRFNYNIQSGATGHSSAADAVIVATGFDVYNPVKKPYGYGLFKNVITNLELEKMLRKSGNAVKPSDGMPPDKIAFIQCVGSRDSKLGHLWCSKVCCAASLRMARLIKVKRPETSITFFYIDIQGSGNNFDELYRRAKEAFSMIRAIPGDIYKSEKNQLKVTYYDSRSRANIEDIYDMVVLSVAIIPGSGTKEISEMLGISPCDTGFAGSCDKEGIQNAGGVFFAGTAGGPLSIAESITHAGKAAWDAAKYIKGVRDSSGQGGFI
jgi:heterodisulfide reductase subunit A2